jgi:hypothetical protein
MKIHIHSKPGLYTVETYGRETIALSTKHTSFQVPVDDFKSFAGGTWNIDVSQEEIDLFLITVKPEEYKRQMQQEEIIITLANMINEMDGHQHTEDIDCVIVEDDDDDMPF